MASILPDLRRRASVAVPCHDTSSVAAVRSVHLSADVSASVGDDCAVLMTADDFLAALASEVPETQQLVTDHLEDNDQLLLHLLTADLRRFAIDAFASRHREVLGRLLDLIDRALRDGMDDVNNAMAASFVEDTGWWDPAMKPFIEAWPSGLQAEAERQRNWRPS